MITMMKVSTYCVLISQYQRYGTPLVSRVFIPLSPNHRCPPRRSMSLASLQQLRHMPICPAAGLRMASRQAARGVSCVGGQT